MTGLLIPNAKQQFVDANGVPVVGGFVYHYIAPSTTTPKDTWADQDLTIKNQNPIVLDGGGWNPDGGVWGETGGTWRQVFTDRLGNVIWDKITSTASTIASGTLYDMFIYHEEVMTDGEIFPIANMPRACTLPVGLVASLFTIGVLPTAPLVLTLKKNSTTIGAITFATNGHATVSFLALVSFNAGDQFSVTGPVSADPTGAGVALTFVFTATSAPLMTTYTMVTVENYDPTWVFGIDDPMGVLPANFGLMNKISTGVRFDPVRRKFLYCVGIYNTSTQVNSTGTVLWDGLTTIALGGNYNATTEFTQWIAEKDIDTGAVVFHQCYDGAKTVPGGIGPTAIGEYDFTVNPTPGQNVVLNGVTWTFVASGATGPQTNIKGTTLDTINQLSWDLNNSTNPALSGAWYASGDRDPPGTVALGITYRTGGTGGNSYTLAAGTYGGTPSGATLSGGGTPSDGTWGRFVDARSSGNGGDPLMVDPRTGNVWQHTDSANLSCAIYLFRLADSYAQAISPYQPPPGQSSHMELVGMSDTWTYVRLEQGNQTHFYTITLTPRDIATPETVLDTIVPYAEFVYDPLWNGYYFRSVFNHSTSLFTYGGAITGTRAFKLFKFTEPTSAPFGGPTVGGGFTDLTPWGPSTGPNSNCAAWTVDGHLATPSTEEDNKYSLYYLPVADQLVCINKLWAGDTASGWSDPTGTRFDCTYLPATGGSFDYHEAFVTGYMKADWTTTNSAAAAAWVVLGVRELDLYLGQNTYAFAVNYTKRWFYFDCQPVTAGSWSYDATKYHTIMVQYQFVSGAPPAVVQVLDEQGWDDAYSAYGTSIGNPNVVYNSLGQFSRGTDALGDAGYYDLEQSAFYWCSNDTSGNTCYLTPAYLAFRQDLINGGEITGPFLKLSFTTFPPGPKANWLSWMGPVVPPVEPPPVLPTAGQIGLDIAVSGVGSTSANTASGAIALSIGVSGAASAEAITTGSVALNIGVLGVGSGSGTSGIPVTLKNFSSSTFTSPLLSFVQVFADGDIPPGGSVVVKDSTGTPVVSQMDQVAFWPSGCARSVNLSFICSETFTPSALFTYRLSASFSPPNNVPNSGVWGGTSKAAIISAFTGACAFQARCTGFDAGAATYVADVNYILANYNDVTSGWGTSYPRGGYEFCKFGPACVEVRAWEYVKNQGTGNTRGYQRLDFYIKMQAPGGPYAIDGSLGQPNMWNTVPLSSVAEQFGNKQTRFASVIEIFNGVTRVGTVGGPNDLRAVSGISANFNTSTNRYSAPFGTFFPQQGVAFATTGALPGGNMASGVVYWPGYPGGTDNPYLFSAKVIAGNVDNGNFHNWATGLGVAQGAVIFNPNNNLWYYYTGAGTTAGAGSGPAGTGSGISDGSATCDCCSLQFTSQGSGTVSAYPIYPSYAGCAFPFVDQVGNPLWVGAGAFPDIFPGHDFTYLTTRSKFVPQYNPVATIPPGAAVPLYTNYGPQQAVGGLPTQAIDSSGDGVGDQRVGYVSEWAVCSLFQPAEPKYVRSTIQMALSMMNFPLTYMYDESGGHPFVGNNGTGNSGVPYTNFPPLLPAWNANNTAGAVAPGVVARGADWSGWDLSLQNQTGYNTQYYFDSSHFPCTWQVPWLKTGRTIFLEQGLAHADAQCFMTYNGSQTLSGYTYYCLIAGAKNSDQLRAFGWAWRTLCQAMYIVPNNHSFYPVLRDYYDDNAKWQALRLPTFPANQGVLGFWPNDVEQGVAGGVGGWAAWMGFFCMFALNMEDWRGGLTPQEAINGYWGQAADYYARQWQIWSPTVDPNAVNYCATYRTVYGPNTSNWSTAYTSPATVLSVSYTTGNSQTVAPYPPYPFDNDNSSDDGVPPFFMIISGNYKAWNYYGNMARMAAKLRILANPSDTTAAAFLLQFTFNIKARTGVSSDGGFVWGYVDHGGSGINPLTFDCF